MANTKISLNAEELKTFLEYIHANNQLLISKKLACQTVNIEGAAGGGKTSSILEFANHMGLELVRRNLAEYEDVSDLVGYPCKMHKVIKGVVEKWVTESSIPQYIQSGYTPTEEMKMTHAAPEWIQGRTKPFLLLLDDYSRSSEKFMQATMTLIENQSYNNWKLPEGSLILLTSNPDNGVYSVTTFDNAQSTRMINVNYKFDIDVWARWAEKTGIDGRAINFLLLNPELIKEDTEVNARTVTMFFNSLMSIPDFMTQLPLIQQLGEATTTPELTIMFTQFINNKLDKLIHPKKILFDDNEKQVMSELKACIGTGNNYRADIASILTTRVINTAMQFAEDNPIEQKTIDRLITLTTDPDTLTDDLKYVLIKKIVNGNKQKFQRLMVNSAVLKIAVK